jgi:Na+-driven multidrug efflux pump
VTLAAISWRWASWRPAGSGGWIGYWAPGIGDPTFVGWATVVLYFAAALACWRILRSRDAALSRAERWAFRCLLLGLVGLGINKQLDLQSALTEMGRILAVEQGWYEQRRRVQRVFILGVGVGLGAVAVLLLNLMRHSQPSTRVTLLGATGLLAFVLIRASSFHHVDLFIHATVWGLRGNWILEIGGLLIILAGTLWRWRRGRPARSGQESHQHPIVQLRESKSP